MKKLSVTIKPTLNMLLIGFALLQVASCSSGGSDPQPSNDAPVVDPNESIPLPTSDDIATTLLMRSDYQTLLRLVELAGLTEVLQTDNDGAGWTLFAPSDVAFAAENDASLFTSEDSAELVQLHLFSGRISSADLQAGTLDMSRGSVDVQISEAGFMVGDATIVGRDRVVGNGIIHFVDSVLLSTVN